MVKMEVFSYAFVFCKTYHGVEELVQKKLMESADTKSLSVEYADCYDDQIVVSSCKGADSFLSNEGVMYEAGKTKRNQNGIITAKCTKTCFQRTSFLSWLSYFKDITLLPDVQ